MSSLFSKRHYEWLARWLDNSPNRANVVYASMCQDLARQLQLDNPRFDKAKFYKAAGFSPEHMGNV
jgi:hypothetical protein